VDEQARAERGGEPRSAIRIPRSRLINSIVGYARAPLQLGLGFNLPLQSGRRGGAADAKRERAGTKFESEILGARHAARKRVV